MRSLITSISDGFHTHPLAAKGEVVGTYSTPWGSTASVVLDRGASVLTWSNTPVSVRIKTRTVQSGTNGEKVGTIGWVAGKSSVIVPLALRGRIHGPSTWWRLTHPAEVLGW